MRSGFTLRLVFPARADVERLAGVLQDVANREDDTEQARMWNELANTCARRALYIASREQWLVSVKRRPRRGDEGIHEDKIEAVVRGRGPDYPDLSMEETLIAVERMVDRGLSSRLMAPRLQVTRRTVDRYRREIRERKKERKTENQND